MAVETYFLRALYLIYEILLKVNHFAADKGNSLIRRVFIEADFLHNSLMQFFFYKSLLVQDADQMFFSMIKR